jgi:hypothetical protein
MTPFVHTQWFCGSGKTESGAARSRAQNGAAAAAYFTTAAAIALCADWISYGGTPGTAGYSWSSRVMRVSLSLAQTHSSSRLM